MNGVLSQRVLAEFKFLLVAVPATGVHVITILAFLVHGDVFVDKEIHLGIGRINTGFRTIEKSKVLDAVIRSIQEPPAKANRTSVLPQYL